ncbi:uncharacterized protein LOC134222094 [Armigeres subalbatus]|uniref:uncharacterized protein LOC134222094 n=1 Tax=Armigeres subalbatus TaxID=124917 RepID=UPI002ED42AB9
MIFDVHKKHSKGDLVFIEVCYRGRDLANLTNMHHALRRFDRNSKERKNLRGYAMPTGVAITVPETHTGISDTSDTIHDQFAKANFPLVKELMYDMNFTLNMIQVDQGGWKTNGTFNGLMGLFQNRTVELAGMGNLMRSERMEVVDFTIVTLLLKTSVIFKQPPLSLVSNIFELPFSGEVWLSCLGFIIACWITMMSFRFISRLELLTPADSLTFIIGTMCQQSIDLASYFNSTKFLFFVAKLASFFIFTAYSATIVALLQSPSKAITSVDDLTASPLKVGAMDVVYVWVYFNESKDPQVQRLFRKKIKPFGKKALIEAEVGMKRVKDELYAFQTEVNAAYHLIKETFTPQDTCKIHELEAIKVAPFSIPVKKGSKYRNLFRQRLIWQMEVGIIHRTHMIWVAQKPKCESGVAAFNSVGLHELRSLYIFLGIGLAVALSILGAELYWMRRLQMKLSNYVDVDEPKMDNQSAFKLVYQGGNNVQIFLGVNYGSSDDSSDGEFCGFDEQAGDGAFPCKDAENIESFRSYFASLASAEQEADSSSYAAEIEPVLNKEQSNHSPSGGIPFSTREDEGSDDSFFGKEVVSPDAEITKRKSAETSFVRLSYSNRDKRHSAKFFLNTLGYGEHCGNIVYRMIDDTEDDEEAEPSTLKRGKYERSSDLRNSVKAHIAKYNSCISHYRRVHAPNRLYLPTDLSIIKMHKNYNETHEPGVSYQFYGRTLKSLNIAMVKLGHEECETCISAKLHQKTLGHSIEDLASSKSCAICRDFKEHRRLYTEARVEYEQDGESVTPGHVVLAVDLQKVIQLPRLDGLKTIVFSQRLIAFNETFAPVGKYAQSTPVVACV